MKQGKFNGFNKIGAGLLFTASCFIAAFVLAEFHEVYIAVALSGILLLISAYFLLTSMLSGKTEEWSQLIEEKLAEEEEENENENENEEEKSSLRNGEGEFREQVKEYMKSNDRTQRAVFALLKRTTEEQKASLTEFDKKLDRLTEEQAAGVKTIVKYNKENARQIAINERETISELKKSMVSELKENSEEIPVMEVPQPVAEKTQAPEPEPEPAAEEASYDPNAALTPEEIAKLFASFGN